MDARGWRFWIVAPVNGWCTRPPLNWTTGHTLACRRPPVGCGRCSPDDSDEKKIPPDDGVAFSSFSLSGPTAACHTQQKEIVRVVRTPDGRPKRFWIFARSLFHFLVESNYFKVNLKNSINYVCAWWTMPSTRDVMCSATGSQTLINC